MRIESKVVQTSPVLYKKVFRVNVDMENSPKNKKRYSIEQNVGPVNEAYDIYDMYADLANAFNDLIKQIPNIEKTEAITKYIERQESICKLK